MPTKTRWILGWLTVVLLLVNYAIYQKETHLRSGTTVCLRLAPVDPRSLMQGDYMALRFALADTIRKELDRQNTPRDRYRRLPNSDGRVVLRLDANCTASYVALFTGQTKRKDQYLLHYRVRNGTVKIATNAFFFEEGKAKRYDRARYGIFRLHNAEPLLVDLADANLTPLSPPAR